MGGFLDALQVHTPGGPMQAAMLAAALLACLFGFKRVAGAGPAALVTVGALGAFVQVGHTAIPLAIAGAGVLLALRSNLPRRPGSAFARELGLVLGGFALYELGRFIVVSPEDRAVANAERIISFERASRTFFEPHLQDFVTGSETATRLFNLVYSHSFLAIVAATVLWLYFADPARYRLYRNALAISTALALALILVFPVAPPRLMPELGLADTVVTLGNEHAFANEFAAVPSLHVGWLALTGFVLALPLAGWRRWLVGLGPGLGMGATVVVTGNHYWVDGVIGSAITVGPAVELRYNVAGRLAQWTRTTWAGLAPHAQRRVRASALSLGGLFLYLGAAQALDPGFTDFWGYLFFQVGATVVLLTAGEVVFAKEGGLSWITHGIAVVCSFADVFGTDGNLYARIDEYDKLTHFMGTGAFAAGAYEILRAVSVRTGRLRRTEDRLYLAMAVAIAVGIGWEVYEYLGDQVFHTTRTQGRWDTLNDVISDSLGALAIGVLLWFQERATASAPAPEEVRARRG